MLENCGYYLLISQNLRYVVDLSSIWCIISIGGDVMHLGEKLQEVRETAKISRAELSQLLLKRGFDVKTYTLSKWETGVSNPTVEAFLAICDICNIADIRFAFSDKRHLRLYELPVSAGFGSYLDNNDYTMIEVDSTVPLAADYAITVSGNSMTPRFIDKQIIFIHEQPTLDEGEIGIFSLNSEAYLKKLEKGHLVSLNPDYSPIPIGEFDDFRVFGKVVG